MEDAAVQAGSMSGKSRSSQTPRPTTPRPTPNPTRSTGDGVWDLLRTQSLPPNCQEWLGALTSSEDTMAEFGNAAAEYALKVSRVPCYSAEYNGQWRCFVPITQA